MDRVIGVGVGIAAVVSSTCYATAAMRRPPARGQILHFGLVRTKEGGRRIDWNHVNGAAGPHELMPDLL